MLSQVLRRVALADGQLTGEESVQHHSERVNVGRRRERFAPQLLGARVVGGHGRHVAGDGMRRSACRGTEQAGKAEIQKFDATILGHQHVAAFQIPVDGQPLMNVLHRAAERAKKLEAVLWIEMVLLAILEQIATIDAFHDQIELAVVHAAAVEQTRDVRMTESGQHLPFAAEALEKIAGLETGAQDLHRDLLLELPVVAFCPVHPAHAAGTDFPDDAIGSNTPIRPVVIIVLRIRKEVDHRRRIDEVIALGVRGKQLLDLALQLAVGATHFKKVLRALRRIAGERVVEQLLHSLPVVRRHDQKASCSSRCSQARAIVHSRFTVAAETPSAKAVSSIVMPPKKRSSTSCACRESMAFSFSKARSTPHTSAVAAAS